MSLCFSRNKNIFILKLYIRCPFIYLINSKYRSTKENTIKSYHYHIEDSPKEWLFQYKLSDYHPNSLIRVFSIFRHLFALVQKISLWSKLESHKSLFNDSTLNIEKFDWILLLILQALCVRKDKNRFSFVVWKLNVRARIRRNNSKPTTYLEQDQTYGKGKLSGLDRNSCHLYPFKWRECSDFLQHVQFQQISRFLLQTYQLHLNQRIYVG